jgi:hypothetical protein
LVNIFIFHLSTRKLKSKLTLASKPFCLNDFQHLDSLKIRIYEDNKKFRYLLYDKIFLQSKFNRKFVE